jgi:hypothetical protein
MTQRELLGFAGTSTQGSGPRLHDTSIPSLAQGLSTQGLVRHPTLSPAALQYLQLLQDQEAIQRLERQIRELGEGGAGGSHPRGPGGGG